MFKEGKKVKHVEGVAPDPEVEKALQALEARRLKERQKDVEMQADGSVR